MAAAIATWSNVVEMRNERNQLYKPQMIFESSYFNNDLERPVWGIWDVRNLIVLLNDDVDNYPHLETTIYNIGSGPALEIELSFMLDNYEEYVEAIGQYYSDGTITTDNSKFTIHYDGSKLRDYVYRGDFIKKKPFLLSGESINIVFPKEYCKLLYYLICCTNGDYGWVPVVHLQICFLDLQGNRYCKDYELVVQVVTSPSELGDRYIHVNYNVEQV